jgi:putative flippase GtrA
MPWILRKGRSVSRVNSFLIFIRSQVSAFLGAVTDYSAMIIFTEVVHIHYTISIVIGGSAGAVVNFLINRYWAFKSDNSYASPAGKQLLRFACVAAGSILLKTFGTWVITENSTLNYKISRLIVDAFVAYGFNFVLMKYWVFRDRKLA